MRKKKTRKVSEKEVLKEGRSLMHVGLSSDVPLYPAVTQIAPTVICPQIVKTGPNYTCKYMLMTLWVAS